MRKTVTIITSIAIFTLSIGLSSLSAADMLEHAVRADYPNLKRLYHLLHRNPELSEMEFDTAKRLAREVRNIGFNVTEKIGKTGIVAVMKNGPGPVVLVRTDMDGLPIVEKTGLPYASKKIAKDRFGINQPTMHACGHDIHMTVWAGVARRMAQMKSEWSGTLVMIAQPAEEIGTGARLMLEDGLYQRFPKPDYALALHNSAELPAGMLSMTPGYALANVDTVEIRVRGIGSHGAYPHYSKDPIVIASQIVIALQTLISRERNPLDPAVITVGAFHAGTKENIISDEAILLLTVRSFTDQVRKALLDGIKRIARAQAMSAGVPDKLLPIVKVRDHEYTPSVYNDKQLTHRVDKLLKERFGSDHVKLLKPVMAGEDFSRYSRYDKSVKGLIFWLGTVNKAKYDEHKKSGRKLPSLHSPKYAPDPKPTIITGVEAMTTIALELLKKQPLSTGLSKAP